MQAASSNLNVPIASSFRSKRSRTPRNRKKMPRNSRNVPILRLSLIIVALPAGAAALPCPALALPCCAAPQPRRQCDTQTAKLARSRAHSRSSPCYGAMAQHHHSTVRPVVASRLPRCCWASQANGFGFLFQADVMLTSATHNHFFSTRDYAQTGFVNKRLSMSCQAPPLIMMSSACLLLLFKKITFYF